MKNIFLKETNQESELYHNTHANVYGYSKNVLSMGGWVVNQFIYITNDEEIKEGDWFIHYSHGTTSLLKAIEVENRILDNQGTSCNIDYCKKVVLTNDPSLIEDGVQQVNSSFLSFYAENTPDYVEVIKELNETDYNICVDYTYSYSLNFPPKENREQSSKTEENIIDQWLEKYGNPEIMKQVEREAEELEWQHFLNNEGYHDKESNDIWKIGCLDGAIWQKSRMYSEEEVLGLLHRFNYDLVNSNIETFKEWFDEHKKQTK